MDPTSIVLIVLVALLLLWLVFKAFSNARHSPPTKLRGGQHGTAVQSDAPGFGFGEDLNQEAPGGSTASGWKSTRPKRGDEHS